MTKVLKFYADWCGPCKAMTRVIEGIDTKTPIVSINIDNDTELAVKYGIRSVPTMILVDENNTELRRRTGLMTADDYLDFVGEK